MRSILSRAAICLTLAVPGGSAIAADKPLSLHPDNPHGLLFRGKPSILLTSGEHYGAVHNPANTTAPSTTSTSTIFRISMR
jgi:hypothetical protein